MYSIEVLNSTAWVAVHGEGCLGEGVKSATLTQSSNSIGSLTLTLLPTCEHRGLFKPNARVRAKNLRSGEYEFYGRVIEVEPKMESDGAITKEVTCEDALGFLQDTCVWFDSRKAWFEGENKKWPVEIDEEDESRTMQSVLLAKLLISQHNTTIGDDGGDKWKRLTVGTCDVDEDEDSTFDAEYEATTFEMLGDAADDADFEFRSRYDGKTVYIDMADQLGQLAGTFKVGDNCAATALVTSMADTATRLFPYGTDYVKLEKKRRKGTKVSGRLKSSEWQSGKGTMVRFPCEKSLKCVLEVGKRDKDYAMVVFAKDKLTKANAKKAVVKKYTPSTSSGTNVTKRYAVPDKAKYVYVFGADSKCTTYGYYRNSAGTIIGKNYRTDLKFWKNKLSDSAFNKILRKYGCTLGSVVDGSGDRSYYLGRNEDTYGAVEYSVIKDQAINVDKITNGSKAVYSINDLKSCNKTKAKAFVKWACRKAKKKAKKSIELTVTGYDLAEAGLDYDALKLYDTWRVENELCGIDHTAEVVRVERDLLEPWSVTVELGSKVTRASSSTRGTGFDTSGGSTYDDGSDDGDDAADEYATLMGEAAEAAAEIAIEKADELDSESYQITVDAQAAGQLATEAYDKVAPITAAMRGLLEDAEEQADTLTSVIDRQEQTISLSNELAQATATYACETEKSVVRWRQTYTADLDAWASDDEAVQKEIAEAYQLLYGGTVKSYETTDGDGNTVTKWHCVDDSGNETGPANVQDDSAQGHLNSAKAEKVAATQTKAEMEAAKTQAESYLAACKSGEESAQAAYKKAKAAYEAAKKKAKKKSAKRLVDTTWTAFKAAESALASATAKVEAAQTRCDEASANFNTACEELEAAEQKVTAAEAEVDTALDGIHEKYSSTIEQTAKSITSAVSKTDGLETKYTELKQTCDGISTTVASKIDASEAKSICTQTIKGWTWSISDIDGLSNYMSFTSTDGTGTLALGGQSSKVVVGQTSGSNVTISSGGDVQFYSNGHLAMDISVDSSYANGCCYIKSGGISSGTAWVTMSPNSSSYGITVDSNGLQIGSSKGSVTGSLTCGSASFAGDVTNTSPFYSSGVKMHENILPKTNEGASCGTSSYKWSAVYGKKIYADGTQLTSSREVKENIEPESEEKAKGLLGVEVVKYDYKAEFRDDDDRKGWYGVIAEDVHDAFPEVVGDWDVPDAVDSETGETVKTYPGVMYSAFVPHIIKLCQMQQAQIDDLTAKVAALEGGATASGDTAAE